LHFSEILDELDITIHTRGHSSGFEGLELFDMFVACKAKTMDKLLKQECEENGPLNSVLCIGDSDYELLAIKEVVQSYEQGQQPLCKTVKFVSDPNIEILDHQLRTLSSWMAKIVAFEANFDMVLDEE